MPGITISIPVTIGGYTGQRDAWEQSTHHYELSIEGDQLTLKNNTPWRNMVQVSLNDLQAAVAAYTRLEEDK